MSNDKCKLYLISPPSFDLDIFSEELDETLSSSEVPVFQLRMKQKSSDGYFTSTETEEKIITACKKLIPICHKNKTIFILNDNVDIAKKVNADGVHLGDEDLGISQARKILGNDKIIGASCYGSKDLAYNAGNAGANYVAFGQFYETKTKKPKGKPNLDILEFWRDFTTIPSVAIGGIKVENCEPIVRAGADFISVVTGVWNYEKGSVQAVKDFNKIFDKYS